MNHGKILFYCQNLLGIGHLTRSLAISRELIRDSEVHFVQGGPDVGKTIEDPDFFVHPLAPLLMREEDSSLYDPSNQRSVEEVFSDRRKALALLSTQSFDHCIVELWPFGRRKFKREILEMIADLKKANPAIRVHCSLRDILVGNVSMPGRPEEISQIIRDHFDTVLVHSDPRFFRLEQTFLAVDAIADKIRYTGFVTEETPLERSPSKRENRILVSLGGGSVGRELMESLIPLVDRFPGHEFTFVPGPFSPADLTEKLSAAQKTKKNLELLPFLNDFEAHLSRCTLSISLAGYNTVMNLLNTRTYGLVLPYLANNEQSMRARRFEEEGLMKVLEPTDLSSDRLETLIRQALGVSHPAMAVDLSGARATREFLRSTR